MISRLVSAPAWAKRVVAGCLLAFAACTPESASGPAGGAQRPPYLAIVVAVEAPPEVTSRGPYTFRVRDLSGTLPIDTVLRATPKDTIIIHVEPATYRIDIADVPATCGVRDGNVQAITVPPNTNTSLVRFFINCTPSLAVAALTDGAKPDTAYVLTVKGATGPERVSIIAANDTVRLDDLAPGAYSVTLRHVADHCLVTSDGGESVTVSITKTGGTFVSFRIVCAEVARRPRIVQLSGSYANGSVGVYLRATDPDRDIERSFLDVTDCNRRSVLPGGGRRRGEFSGFPNVTGKDTAVIVGGYDLALPDSAFAGRCIAVWVADERGNTSEFVERPIVPRSATRSPAAATLNARFNGTRGLQVQIAPSDPDGNFAGMFLVYTLRDAVVSFPADGVPDRLVSHPAGLIDTVVPELPFGIGFGAWNDYLGVIVYLLDRAGNVTRIEDNDLFR